MTTYLVDGSNVARSRAWEAVVQREVAELPRDLAGAANPDPRARLADWIMAWRTHSGHDVVLVFDGAGPQGAGRRQWDHGYLIIGSGREEGDSVIEAEAARLAGSNVPFRLVTNDHALGNVAGSRAEAVLSVEGFVADLAREPADRPGTTSSNTALEEIVTERTTLADDLDDDVRAKLERMRRGLDA